MALEHLAASARKRGSVRAKSLKTIAARGATQHTRTEDHSEFFEARDEGFGYMRSFVEDLRDAKK